MPLDTNIAMGGKLFKMTDPMENAQNAEIIRKSRFDNNQAERALAAENKLAQLLAQGGDEQAVSQGLYGEGYYNKAKEFGVDQATKRKSAADLAKTGQETQASQFKLQKDKSDRLLNAVGSLAFKTGVTKQDIYSVIGGLVNDGTVDEDMADQMAMDVDATPDTDLYKLLHKTGRSLIDAKTQYEMARKESDAEYRAMNDEKNRQAAEKRARIMGDYRNQQVIETEQGPAILKNGLASRVVDAQSGAPVMPKKSGKPTQQMPVAALKMQQEASDAIGNVKFMNADLSKYVKQIESGDLDLGAFTNYLNKGKNLAGYSDKQSRNLASFEAALEKLRNDSLRLNSGVQTDGDAQRAWNELLTNINDPDVVKQRLGEIQRINERGAALQRMNIDAIRRNYGLDQVETAADSGNDNSGGWSAEVVK